MKEALALIGTFGGISNIINVGPRSLCIHVEVKSQREVNETAFRIPSVLAIVRSGSFVRVAAGPESEVIARKVREQISSP